MTAMTQKILILDFGSQYNQLIARRIRENGVYCEIHPFDVSVDKIKDFSPCAIVLSGGPDSVYEKDSPHADSAIFELGVPILAICYGMQYMAQSLGGEVVASEKREYGKANLKPTSSLPFLNNITSPSVVWMSHGDKVSSLPDGFTCIAESDNAPFAAIAHEQKNFYGLQFHPEVTHSVQGEQWIKNFLFEICGCKKDWNMDSFVEEATQRIKEEVGDKRVLCGLSGGVDSSVAAVLIHKAIGSNLTCVFVDNGLLRKNEKEKVESVFRNHFGIHLVVVDAADTFLQQLKGVIDPEQKRKIIGHAFIDVFEEYGKKEGPFDFLAQGTLYPDVIESVSAKGGPTATIKSHHNVGGLPDDMALKLVEPLRELFKDEVRRLGRVIGVPDEILDRHPFPGPGLGVRIIGEVTKTRCDVLREADKIVLDEIKKAGLYHQIWQVFAVYLPLKTVGVMGDSRTYEDVIAVRAVESFDGMTADWSRIPYEVLEIISSRIINEVKGINRVVLDISSKPPATIEWE